MSIRQPQSYVTDQPSCSNKDKRVYDSAAITARVSEEEEEEEEDLFVFNDTIDGPRAPAVKPGRITQA